MGWVIGILTTFLVILAKKSSANTSISQHPVNSLYNAESWRSLFNEMRGDIPQSFGMKWMEVESDFNPCATGGGIASNGKTLESGLTQLFYPDDYNRLGYNIDKMRAYCQNGSRGASQVCIRALTQDEKVEQVKSVVDFINDSRSYIARVGIRWDKSTPDYWIMVKLKHGIPAVLIKGWNEGTRILGHIPNDWNDFKKAVRVLNIATIGKYPTTGWIVAGKLKDGRDYYYTQATINKVLFNAEKVGSVVI